MKNIAWGRVGWTGQRKGKKDAQKKRWVPQNPEQVQMPLLHNGTQRKHKDFSSDVPSNDVFDVASDAKCFWKIMVVVVFGPSLTFTAQGGTCRYFLGVPDFQPGVFFLFCGNIGSGHLGAL